MAAAGSVQDEERTFATVFPDSSKLDAYGMALEDIAVFEEAGFQRDQVGMLATYGFVDFAGVRTLLRGIAERLRPGSGDLPQALAGMHFLDLGSGDGRAVIGAALLAPTLAESRGVELSVSRHELAVRNRSRLPKGMQDIVRFQQIDILQVEPTRLGATEIVWLANLRFPDETVEAINQYLEMHCARDVDAVVATLRECSFRRPHEAWTMEVSMSWNPQGWPVFCYLLPRAENRKWPCWT
ncbi:argC [Symbiodinium natans]|uniref:ArgC protein n=1 Tax=Symbiodinium natans TaxID=878477 RepID=A0A812GJV0_9DINO|nr:argC [Symbiodinium natans]